MPEAIALFEKIGAQDLLAAEDLQALADWYMALDQRDKYRQTRIAMYEHTEEWDLEETLSDRLKGWERSTQEDEAANPFNAGPSESNPFKANPFKADPFAGPARATAAPATRDGVLDDVLDDEVLQIFAALLAKASEPDDYLDLLSQYYAATRDFRLLTGLADAVIGKTGSAIYAWLDEASVVIQEVREEATVDALVAHVAQVRERAKSAVDRRALDLLELMIERRAVELLDQPGPHAQRALAAMQRAFAHEWAEGEPRLMADFLASLAQVPDAALAGEQVRQLEVLYQQAEVGTFDRLEIAHALSKLYRRVRSQDRRAAGGAGGIPARPRRRSA